MVVRNMRLRMNGFAVGGWRDVLDADQLRMDMVEAFQTCISDNALLPKDDPEEAGQLLASEEASQERPAKRSAPPGTTDPHTPSKRQRRVY